MILSFTIAVLLFAAWIIRHAVLLIYISAVFATVLKPGVDWLHTKSILGWRPGRGAALLLFLLALCILLGILIAIALPATSHQLAP